MFSIYFCRLYKTKPLFINIIYSSKMINSLINFISFKTPSGFLRAAMYSTTTLGHVLIGGGTGFIGSNLREMLVRENYKVTVISRVKTGEKHIVTWADIIQYGIPNGVTAVVNVTGMPIMTPFKYFGTGFKKQIRTSRVGSTVLLADIIRRAKSKPEVLIAVTSTDIYPPSDEIYTEEYNFTNSMITKHFFTELGTDLEKYLKQTEGRWVSIRAGTVFGHKRGFMRWLNYTTVIGDGCQYHPWIHICDLVYLILFSIEHKQVKGVLNGVSPEVITNDELTTMYAQMVGRSKKFYVPRIIMKGVYGKERSEIMLKGKLVSPEQTRTCGFQFEYPEIEKALKHLLMLNTN